MTTQTGENANSGPRYVDSEIVVALRHLPAIEKELAELGVKWDPAAKKSPRLGLALLKLTNIADTDGVLRQKGDGQLDGERLLAEAAETRSRTGITRPSKIPRLDLLMFVLRKRFARRYGGWEPDMAKNRYVMGVAGLKGEIGGGGSIPPTALPAGQSLVPALGERGRGVRVAVLDSAIWEHPDLVGRFKAPSEAMLPGASHYTAFQGHATFVAGLILQRAPGAELEVRRVLDDEGEALAWDVANAMVEFVDNGVDIMNMSFGCATDDGKEPLVLRRAVDLLSPQTVLVAAAGNHGKPRSGKIPPDTPIYPAAFHDVIAVGAHDTGCAPAPFTACLLWNDLTAPGVGVTSTYLAGDVLVPADDKPSADDQPSADEKPLAGKETRPTPFHGAAQWSGSSFAAANASGQIAAHTKPGGLSARQVAEDLLAGKLDQGCEGTKPWPNT